MAVLGKVTAVEEKSVAALPTPAAEAKAEYQVAVVRVDEALAGVKGVTHVRVGFLPAEVALAKDQKVCLLLKRHHGEAFYVFPALNGAWEFVIGDVDNANFDNEVALVRRCGKLLDGAAGLKSKDPDERLLTAMLLVERYRQGPFALSFVKDVKQEPIDADESKRILEALADADLNATQALLQQTPLTSYYQLREGEENGAPSHPDDPAKQAAAAKKWLKENAGTYRIRRLVPDKPK